MDQKDEHDHNDAKDEQYTIHAHLGLNFSGMKTLFKLCLIYADGSGNADHAVSWNLTLNLSEISRTFANFCRHRHDLVLSSKHGDFRRSR
jgi:hypothetical protein